MSSGPYPRQQRGKEIFRCEYLKVVVVLVRADTVGRLQLSVVSARAVQTEPSRQVVLALVQRAEKVQRLLHLTFTQEITVSQSYNKWLNSVNEDFQQNIGRYPSAHNSGISKYRYLRISDNP